MFAKAPSILNIALIVLTLSAFYVGAVLLGVGLYNPYGKVDYFLGGSTWSADSRHIQFQASFPLTLFYVLDLQEREIEQVTSLPNWINEENQSGHNVNLARIEEQFGSIEQHVWSPNGNFVALIISSSTPVWPVTLYSETIVIYDSASSEVMYTVERSDLLRLSDITSLFFTTSGSTYEGAFHILGFSTGFLLIVNLKHIRLRRLATILVVLFMSYGLCAFFSYLGWASR